MASVTINDSKLGFALSNKAVAIYNIDIAASGDTLATGMAVIDHVSIAPSTNSAVGRTISGGTITLITGGALTGVTVEVIGDN